MRLEHHREKFDGRRGDGPKPVLNKPAEIGRPDRHQIGAAQLDARQLIDQRPSFVNLHRIGERTASPVILEGAQYNAPRLESIDAERPAAIEVRRSGTRDNGESGVGELLWQVGAGPVRFDHNHVAAGSDSPGAFLRTDDCRHLRRLQH